MDFSSLNAARKTPKPQSQDKDGCLSGLLDVIRMTNPDKTMLALGLDLTSLGLSLSSLDPLHATFMSPYAAVPSTGAEPTFKSPDCYSLNFKLSLEKIRHFSDEALLYIFYTSPRDMLQEAAAQQLYSRGWRFHKELQLWLTRDPSSDLVVKGDGFERGVYIFFEPQTWTRMKKEFVVNYEFLEEREPL